MTKAGRVLYTAETHTTGGREDGIAHSSDGYLKIRFSSPGTGWVGVNPEQLFAAGWSASLESAIAIAAGNKKIVANIAIDAEVDLNLSDDGYFLSIRLNVSLPGVEQNIARALIEEACRICPYSKATKGNIDVTINLA